MNTKISIILVSFNTKHLIDRCIKSIIDSSKGLEYEIIIVDNASKDGSVEYIREKYNDIKLIESGGNIGFAAANNLGYKYATGEYIVLLNTDAFVMENGLVDAVNKMNINKKVGLAGARLVGENNEWQPSARVFPSILNDLFVLSGLAAKYPHSSIFGRSDMTYKDQNKEIYCDWVPGAFSIIRKEIIETLGLFDERYFLYYEEVDLCKKIKKAGWEIVYWPDIRVIHIGGGSTSLFSEKLVTKSGKQMNLWRLQSQYLYYRKNYGFLKAVCAKNLEKYWNLFRYLKNKKSNLKKAEESKAVLEVISKAWNNTKGGSYSPEKPWKGE